MATRIGAARFLCALQRIPNQGLCVSLSSRLTGKYYQKTITGSSFIPACRLNYTTLATDAEPDTLYKTVELEMKGHDIAVLNSYEKFLVSAAKELDIPVAKVWTPPRVIERYTVLKSAHVHKKHRVQYEARTNYRTVELKHLTGSTADTFLEYIQRNLPEGVAMKVSKHQLESIPQHLTPPTDAASLSQ